MSEKAGKESQYGLARPFVLPGGGQGRDRLCVQFLCVIAGKMNNMLVM